MSENNNINANPFDKRGTITPLFISTINNNITYNDEDFLLVDNTKVDVILIVAKIDNYERHPSCIILSVSDDTGSLSLRISKRLDEKNPAVLANSNIKMNVYHKFFVLMKKHKDIVFIVNSITEITSMNEYTFHIVNCIRSSLIRKNGYIKDATEKIKNDNIYKKKSDNNNANNNNQLGLLTAVQKKIISNEQLMKTILTLMRDLYINKNISSYAASYIADQLGGEYKKEQKIKVIEALNNLCENGDIYKFQGMYHLNNK